jgi:biopolymer transport protein ExbD
LLLFYRYDLEAAKQSVSSLNERAPPLATSRMAKPIDPTDTDVLYLNISGEGGIEVPGGKAPLSTPTEIGNQLKEQFATREKTAGRGQVKTAVVARADKNAPVMQLYRVAQLAVSAGFPKVFVQVRRKAPEEGRLELILPHWRRPESFADVTVHVKTIRDGVNDGKIGALIVQTDKGHTAIPNLNALQLLLKKTRAEEKLGNKDSVRISAEAVLNIASLIEVMDTCLESGFATAALGTPPDLQSDKPGIKRMAPDAASQAKAEKEIKSLYEAVYAKSEPADLAWRLRQAGEVCDDPAAKFVLLREAADAAGRAGNIPASLEALDQLSKEYNADLWGLKLEKFKNAPANKGVVEVALKQAGDASALGRLDYGVRFLKLADIAAKQTKDQNLIDLVEERRVLLKLPRVDDFDPFAALPSSGYKGERPAAPKADAKTPVTRMPDENDASSQYQGMVLWIVIPAIAVISLGGVLFWWLRRGDRAVRSRVAAARQGQFALPAEEPVEQAPPAAEAGPPSQT